MSPSYALYKPRLGSTKSQLLQTRTQLSASQSKESPLILTNYFTTMWKAVVLAVCLLVAGAQPMDDPTYGVKLCGREFIRAVIFTCGGSRWKRDVRTAGES